MILVRKRIEVGINYEPLRERFSLSSYRRHDSAYIVVISSLVPLSRLSFENLFERTPTTSWRIKVERTGKRVSDTGAFIRTYFNVEE